MYPIEKITFFCRFAMFFSKKNDFFMGKTGFFLCRYYIKTYSDIKNRKELCSVKTVDGRQNISV